MIIDGSRSAENNTDSFPLHSREQRLNFDCYYKETFGEKYLTSIIVIQNQ